MQVGMRYLVLGGGVAGVCCVEELCKLCPQDSVSLVSNGNALKVITAWLNGSSGLTPIHIMLTIPRTYAECWKSCEVHR